MKAGADFDEAASAYLEKQGGAKRLLSISRPFELEQITAEHLIQGREQFVLTFKPNVLEGAQQATVDFKVTYGTERQTYFQTEVKGGKVPLGRKVLFWTPGYHHGDKGYAVAVESLFKPAP